MMKVLSLVLLAFAAMNAVAEDSPVAIKPKVRFELPREYHLSPVIRMSADGKRAAIVHASDEISTPNVYRGGIQVWSLAPEPKLLSEFVGGTYCFALSPSGKRLLTSDKFEVYDVATKKPVGRVPDCSHAHFLDDDTLVITQQSHDFARATRGWVKVWSISKNKAVQSFEIPGNRFRDALVTRDGKELWLFMSADKFEVECWDLKSEKLLRTVIPEALPGEKPYSDAGLYASVMRDGSEFSAYVGSTQPRDRIFDPATGKMIGSLPKDLIGSSVGMLPVGTLFYGRPYSNKGNSFNLKKDEGLIYDWKAKKPVATLTLHGPGKKPLNFSTAAVSADGSTMLSVTQEGEALLYDLMPMYKK